MVLVVLLSEPTMLTGVNCGPVREANTTLESGRSSRGATVIPKMRTPSSLRIAPTYDCHPGGRPSVTVAPESRVGAAESLHETIPREEAATMRVATTTAKGRTPFTLSVAT
jgi:hypothetical protein